MKIAIAADLSPRRIGSIEDELFAASRALEGRGAEVRFYFSGPMSRSVREHFRLDEGKVVENVGVPKDPGTRDRWVQLLTEAQPDVAWLHFFPIIGPFIARLRRGLKGTRIVSTEHVSRGYPRRDPARLVARRVKGLLYARCIDRHIAVSRFVARRLRDVDRIPEGRIETIYNGVDLSRFRREGGERSYLTTVCYLRPEKGVGVLLESLAILKSRGLEPELRVVGDGPELERYKGFASDRGLGNVKFLGLRDDVHEILRGSLVTVVPSIWPEAFSLAAAESQAMEVPVIASKVGGLPEVVDDGETGLLVPSGDAEALAGAIAAVTGDPDLRERMGRAGRRKAEAAFDLERQTGRIVELLTA